MVEKAKVNIMKKVYLGVLLCMLIFGACTKNGFIKTGLSNGRFDGNMMEYFKAHSYDWDSTVLLIEKAGLVDLFEGKEDKEITFFGPTNHSIRKWMLATDIEAIAELDTDFCRETLLRYVVVGKFMRDDIPKGKQATSGVYGDGGITLTAKKGNKIWAFTFVDSYNGVEGMGATRLYITSVAKEKKIDVASTNIESDNGVVHSLHYNHQFGDM